MSLLGGLSGLAVDHLEDLLIGVAEVGKLLVGDQLGQIVPAVLRA